VDSLMRLFPDERARVAALFPLRGEHLRLAALPDGSCSFLGIAGCVLRWEVRPYSCRLFPFWVSAGAVTVRAGMGCLAYAEGRTPEGMLPLLVMNHAMARELHGRMRLAWGMSPGGEVSGLMTAEMEDYA